MRRMEEFNVDKSLSKFELFSDKKFREAIETAINYQLDEYIGEQNNICVYEDIDTTEFILYFHSDTSVIEIKNKQGTICLSDNVDAWMHNYKEEHELFDN